MKNIALLQCCFLFIALSFAHMHVSTIAAEENHGMKKAVFAGGCFWCMEKPFEALEGVLSVVSGYTGGRSSKPTYDTYASGGHVEAVEILYNPEKTSYEALLNLFWRQIDPTDPDGQFVDRGKEYATAIFYTDKEQEQLARKSKEKLEAEKIFDNPIITPILPAATFYKAEDHHQDYYRENPIRYRFYRMRSGRDQFLKKIWGMKKGTDRRWSTMELKKRLTPMQYHVTQEEGTEKPFDNAYWDNKQHGIYVDVVSGEPLFSSIDKFNSGTGWPSFSKPLAPENIIEKKDRKLFSVRTEVRSR